MPKRFFIAGAVLGTAIAGFTFLGGKGQASWGPERPTYTINQPADHVTFNSITDNPNYGDERPFLDAHRVSDQGTVQPVDQIKVSDGEEIVLRMYVHNNAAANLNGANFDGKGVATNTRAQITLPKNSGKALRSVGFIMADNAAPKSVQDTADFYADRDFTVEYVPGSAKAVSNAVPAGYQVNDSIVTSPNGALIGYNGPDGKVPGCFEYTMFVVIRVKVKMVPQENPDFTMQKQVRKTGETAWSKEVTANPGDEVEYRVKVSNTGTANMNNPAIYDKLPPHMTYVPGSTMAADAARPNGISVADGITTNYAVFTSTYTPGTQLFVMFKAKVADSAKEECGSIRLRNVAKVHTVETPTDKEDTADVVVNTGKTCEEPVYRCDALTSTKIDRDTFKFTANATAQGGAAITKYVFDFGDGQTQEVASTAPSVTSQEHTYTQTGSKTVKVTVYFTVGGQAQSKVCQTTVTVEDKPVEPVKKCEGLAITKTGNRIEMKVTASVTNTQITGYHFVTKNASGTVVNEQTLNTSAATATHSFETTTPGTYSVVVTVKTAAGDVTSNDCKGTFTIDTPAEPAYGCDALTAKKISRAVYSFTAKATAKNGAVINKYVFDFGDGKSQEVTSAQTAVTSEEHTFAEAKKYTVKVTVHFTVNDQAQTDDCVVEIDVQPEPAVPTYECKDVIVKAIGGRKVELQVDVNVSSNVRAKNYTINFGDGTTPLVTDKNPVQHEYAKDGEFIARVTSIVFDVNGTNKTVTPGDNCAEVIKITTPATPPAVIPSTGAGSVVSAFAGISALGAGLHYAVSTRRKR